MNARYVIRLISAHIRVIVQTAFRHWVTLVTETLYPVVKVAVLIFLLRYVYQSADHALPINPADAIKYAIQAGFLSSILGFNNAYVIADRVKSGRVVFDFLRPVSWFTLMLSEYYGTRVSGALLPALAFAVITCVGHVGFTIAENVRLLLLTPAVLLLDFLISLNVGIVAFWTQNAWGLGLSLAWVQRLLSGIVVPLVLVPPHLQDIAYATPFPSLVDAPIRASLGLKATGWAFTKQICWCVLLALLAAALYRKAVAHIRINGG